MNASKVAAPCMLRHRLSLWHGLAGAEIYRYVGV
jgi:hypothetical protein